MDWPTESEGVVPLFPLPTAVFFPHTVLPLHVFEPRYRQMIEDVQASDMKIAVTLLRGDWKPEYEGSPDLYTVATIGRVEDLVFSEDGRSTFRLIGLERVQLDELPCDRLYRQASYKSFPEPPVELSPTLERKKVDLMAGFTYLLAELGASPTQQLAVNDSLPFASAINHVCSSLPVDPTSRQRLLECELVERLRRAQLIVNELLQRVTLLKGEDSPDDSSKVN